MVFSSSDPKGVSRPGGMLTFRPKKGINLRAGDAAARCAIEMEWNGMEGPRPRQRVL